MMGGPVTLLFLCLILLGALFVLAIFPLWMFADCARSRGLPGAFKALWLMTIVMAWPFGSLAYASFASQKKSMAKLSNILVAALIVTSIFFSAGIYYFRSALLPQAVTHYQKMDFEGVPKEKQERVKSDLAVLQHEMQANSFFSIKSLIALQLFELFQSIVLNPKVSLSDLEDWSKQVALRETIREENLSVYASTLNRKTIQNVFKKDLPA